MQIKLQYRLSIVDQLPTPGNEEEENDFEILALLTKDLVVSDTYLDLLEKASFIEIPIVGLNREFLGRFPAEVGTLVAIGFPDTGLPSGGEPPTFALHLMGEDPEMDLLDALQLDGWTLLPTIRDHEFTEEEMASGEEV